MIRAQVLFKIYLIALLLCTPVLAQSKDAQDTTYWNTGGISSFTFSQVSLTNWAAGGNNSTSIHGYFNVFADYVKGSAIFENHLEVGYGLLNQGGKGFIKADDKINYNAKYGRRIFQSKKWYWTANFNFRTQFDDGFNQDQSERISDWLAPGYIFLSIAIDYKPSKVFWVSYTPLSTKITVVTNKELSDKGAFGVTPGKSSLTELGSYLTAVVKTRLLENVDFESKLQLFSNYKKNPEKIDINWETAFVLKVNSFITTNIISQLIYDEDIDIPTYDDQGEQIGSGPKIQFKNIFGVGLTYKFGNKRKKHKLVHLN